MKSFVAFLSVFVMTAPAWGHFIWLIPPASRDAQGPLMVFSDSPTYGVVSKGKSKPFLLVYHPKTVLRKGFAGEKSSWEFSPSSRLPLEFVPVEKRPAFKVYWQGKPAANVEVTVLAPGMKAVDAKTDADGEVAIPEPKNAAVYGMRARFCGDQAR